MLIENPSTNCIRISFLWWKRDQPRYASPLKSMTLQPKYQLWNSSLAENDEDLEIDSESSADHELWHTHISILHADPAKKFAGFCRFIWGASRNETLQFNGRFLNFFLRFCLSIVPFSLHLPSLSFVISSVCWVNGFSCNLRLNLWWLVWNLNKLWNTNAGNL